MIFRQASDVPVRSDEPWRWSRDRRWRRWAERNTSAAIDKSRNTSAAIDTVREKISNHRQETMAIWEQICTDYQPIRYHVPLLLSMFLKQCNTRLYFALDYYNVRLLYTSFFVQQLSLQKQPGATSNTNQCSYTKVSSVIKSWLCTFYLFRSIFSSLGVL